MSFKQNTKMLVSYSMLDCLSHACEILVRFLSHFRDISQNDDLGQSRSFGSSPTDFIPKTKETPIINICKMMIAQHLRQRTMIAQILSPTHYKNSDLSICTIITRVILVSGTTDECLWYYSKNIY